jgi:hypothetical protein
MMNWQRFAILPRAWFAADGKVIERAVLDGLLQEVEYDKEKKTSRLAKELLATAKGMNKAGILDDVAYEDHFVIWVRRVGPRSRRSALIKFGECGSARR